MGQAKSMLATNPIQDFIFRANFKKTESYVQSRAYVSKAGLHAEKASPAVERQKLQAAAVASIKDQPTRQTLVSLVSAEPALINRYGQLQRFTQDVAAITRPPQLVRKVYYAYGPSGSGKSFWAVRCLKERCVRDGLPESSWDSVHFQSGFILGYTGAKYVLFDDWKPDSLPIETWNQIFDSYPYSVNIKGGSTPWLAERIYITRTHSPADLLAYGMKPDDLLQVVRRFSRVFEFRAEVDETTGRIVRDHMELPLNSIVIPGASYTVARGEEADEDDSDPFLALD